MIIPSDKLERLIFVKYLLTEAEVQKELDRPLSSTAILTLHDLVECFLQLVYEHLTQKTKLTGNNILDTYSEEINKIIDTEGKNKINKAYIKRLNELRNQLKHATIFIDKKNIQNLYSETEAFLSDFSYSIFEISLEDVSIIELVSNETIKSYLLYAESQIKASDYHLAIINIGKAFYEFEQIATEIKNKYGYNLIKRHPNRVNYTIAHEATLGGKPLDSNLKKGLKDIAKDINEIKEEISSLSKIQLLHLDMRKYLLYKEIMPNICKIQSHEGEEVRIDFYIPEAGSLSKESFKHGNVKFCFDFVLETIFSYQSKGYV